MKTVRVRVFVSVGPNGDWGARGGLLYNENHAKTETHHVSGRDAGYWIEADLPLPNQSPEIVATVTRA